MTKYCIDYIFGRHFYQKRRTTVLLKTNVKNHHVLHHNILTSSLARSCTNVSSGSRKKEVWLFGVCHIWAKEGACGLLILQNERHII